jgi:hypothetical protein
VSQYPKRHFMNDAVPISCLNKVETPFPWPPAKSIKTRSNRKRKEKEKRRKRRRKKTSEDEPPDVLAVGPRVWGMYVFRVRRHQVVREYQVQDVLVLASRSLLSVMRMKRVTARCAASRRHSFSGSRPAVPVETSPPQQYLASSCGQSSDVRRSSGSVS